MSQLQKRIVLSVVIVIACVIAVAIIGKLTGAWDQPTSESGSVTTPQ